MMIRVLLLVILLTSVSYAADETDREIVRELVSQIYDGKPEESLAKVEELIKTQGPSAQLLWVKGLALHKTRKLREAAGAYSESIKLNPNQVESYYGRARAFVEIGVAAGKQNDTENAKAAFIYAIKDASKMNAGRSQSVLMVNACEGLGRKIESIRHLNDVIKYSNSNPKDRALLYADRASRLESISALDLAAEDLIASHELNPEITTMSEVLEALHKSRRFDDMVKIMDQRIAAGQTDAGLFLDRFGIMGKAGRVEEALQGFEGLKEKYTDPVILKEIDSRISFIKSFGDQLKQPVPDDVAAKIKQAQELLDAESYDFAAATAFEAGKAARTNPEPSLILGSALLKKGKFREAIKLLSHSIRFGSTSAHRQRAKALTGAGLISNAVFDLEKAFENQPEPDLKIELADAFQSFGEYEKAISAYDDAERLGAPKGELNGFRAYCHWNMGEHQKALDDFAIAFETGDNATWRITRAGIYENLGRYQEAKADFIRTKQFAEASLESSNGKSDNADADSDAARTVTVATNNIRLMDLFSDLQTEMKAIVGADESKSKELTAKFVPTLEVCQAVFVDEFAAIVARELAESYKSNSFVITTDSPEYTSVLVDLSTTDAIIKRGGHNFSRGWEQLATRLRPGNELFVVKFAKFGEPGKQKGMRYEGFFKFKEQWYLLPKPWRIASSPQPSPVNAESNGRVKTTHNGIQVSVKFDAAPQQVTGVGKEPSEEQQLFQLGGPKGVMMIAIEDFPKTEVTLDLAVASFQKTIGGEIASRSDIQLEPDAIVGTKVDFIIPARSGFAKSRMYLIDDRWVHVFAMGTNDYVNSQQAKNFLESVVVKAISNDQ